MTKWFSSALLAAGWALVSGCSNAAVPPADVTLSEPPGPIVIELKSPAGPGSGGPGVTAGADGRVYLSWLEPASPEGDQLRFSVREGQGWSEPRTIASGTNWFVNPADFPSLAVMAGGTLAAHWLVMSGGDESEAYNVQLVFSSDKGDTWTKPVVPHRDGKKRQHGFVSLVPTSDGNIGALWLDGRRMPNEVEGDMALMYTTIGPNGKLGPEVQLDGRTCECCQTSMAATQEGLVAVYRDRSEKEIRDISIVRSRNGQWSGPEPLSQDGWEIPGCPVNGPAVSSNGKNVAVAWFTGVNDKPQVYALLSGDSGQSFGQKIRIDGGNPVGRVDVVSLPSGAAAVSWIERAGDAAEVHVRQAGADRVLAAPVKVSGAAGVRSGGFPRMALSGSEIVIAWADSSDQVRTAIVK